MNSCKIRVGISPIGWTNDDMPELGKENSFERTVDEMAECGYEGCETGSKFPGDKHILKKELDKRRLQLCNSWFSTFFLTKSENENIEVFEKRLEFLSYMGAEIIGISEQGNSVQQRPDVPILDTNPQYTESEWDIVCKGFEKLGKIASKKAITLTVHHHMGTGIQTMEEIDTLMERTNPEYVSLLLDTGHAAFCGIDYIKVFDKYAERIKHIHFKDIRLDVLGKVKEKNLSFLDAVKEGVFTVPGDGDLDFTVLATKMEKSGYRAWVVVEAEQDPEKANPKEYAKKAKNCIDGLFRF